MITKALTVKVDGDIELLDDSEGCGHSRLAESLRGTIAISQLRSDVKRAISEDAGNKTGAGSPWCNSSWQVNAKDRVATETGGALEAGHADQPGSPSACCLRENKMRGKARGPLQRHPPTKGGRVPTCIESSAAKKSSGKMSSGHLSDQAEYCVKGRVVKK